VAGHILDSPSSVRAAAGPRAGFWRRVVAALLDGVLVSAFILAVNAVSASIAVLALTSLLGLAYVVVLEGGASGQTLGRRAVGIRVVDADGGGPIGIPRALLRWAAEWLSALILLLGYLWMLWDSEKQTWHDKLASTLVVPANGPRRS
jgi:uncharacterized RDD family membrane protein YckC